MNVQSVVRGSVRKYVLGIFVDFKGAFDYLRWDRVIERLDQLGCAEKTLWRSCLDERKAVMVGEAGTVEVEVARGCPQGSICGPFIWNLMMDSLLWQLEQLCGYSAYADDLLVLAEGNSRAEVERKGEQLFNVVSGWGMHLGVDISVGKTVAMLIKGKLSLGRTPLVRVNGVSVRYVTQVRYLGLIMGERMVFTPYLVRLKERLVGLGGLVRRLLRSNWGLGRRAIRTIYRGLFVACAAFGSAIWFETAMLAAGRRKVLSCQRVLLLACLPVCRTVSTDALQVLMEEVKKGNRTAVHYGLDFGH